MLATRRHSGPDGVADGRRMDCAWFSAWFGSSVGRSRTSGCAMVGRVRGNGAWAFEQRTSKPCLALRRLEAKTEKRASNATFVSSTDTDNCH